MNDVGMYYSVRLVFLLLFIFFLPPRPNLGVPSFCLLIGYGTGIIVGLSGRRNGPFCLSVLSFFFCFFLGGRGEGSSSRPWWWVTE